MRTERCWRFGASRPCATVPAAANAHAHDRVATPNPAAGALNSVPTEEQRLGARRICAHQCSQYARDAAQRAFKYGAWCPTAAAATGGGRQQYFVKHGVCGVEACVHTVHTIHYVLLQPVDEADGERGDTSTCGRDRRAAGATTARGLQRRQQARQQRQQHAGSAAGRCWRCERRGRARQPHKLPDVVRGQAQARHVRTVLAVVGGTRQRGEVVDEV
eukprot:358334-Chlamydomonas_euryale.AAC.2